jgi:hypothetical protein
MKMKNLLTQIIEYQMEIKNTCINFYKNHYDENESIYKNINTVELKQILDKILGLCNNSKDKTNELLDLLKDKL